MQNVGIKIIQHIPSTGKNNFNNSNFKPMSQPQTLVTFGEIMMRLSPPGFQRLVQTESLDVKYGGGEANVAVALARWGYPAKHVTCFPDSELGQAAAAAYRKYGVDTSAIVFRGERLGLYFLESGAAMRSSRIIYDRKDSAFAHLDPSWFDWKVILQGAGWLHWTGISPAISAQATAALEQGLLTARKYGITISGDLNYRRNLWKWGKTVDQIMPGLSEYCDIAICDLQEAKDIFGIQINPRSENAFVDMAQQVMERLPNLKKILATYRDQVSATHNRLQGRLYDGHEYLETPYFDINPIVDRIGGGDAYMAGFIYGLHKFQDDFQALLFATAASALKHTHEGDFNLCTVDEVLQLMGGDYSGRIVR